MKRSFSSQAGGTGATGDIVESTTPGDIVESATPDDGAEGAPSTPDDERVQLTPLLFVLGLLALLAGVGGGLVLSMSSLFK